MTDYERDRWIQEIHHQLDSAGISRQYAENVLTMAQAVAGVHPQDTINAIIKILSYEMRSKKGGLGAEGDGRE